MRNVVKLTKKLLLSVGLFAALTVPLTTSIVAFAATSPGLGSSNPFVILADTYSNTASGTTLNGDLGYTTPPAVVPTINGSTHQADSVYNQAGIDQNNALIALNNQPCSFTFAPGPIDLASDTTHGPVGTYVPGVYCISGDASIGGGGTITLNGNGAYVFRMDGALTTSANSAVVLSGGASVCDVWWTPTQASTIGADSIFAGTDIDAAGITIGSSVDWTGRALAFGGTVSTDTDTLSAPVCSSTGGGAGEGEGASTPSVPGLPDTSKGANSNHLQWLALLAVLPVALMTAYIIRKKN
jgi:hypothetical protein